MVIFVPIFLHYVDLKFWCAEIYNIVFLRYFLVGLLKYISLYVYILSCQLEAMGFDRALVLEVFFACNKNEELAANYLLDHMHEFED